LVPAGNTQEKRESDTEIESDVKGVAFRAQGRRNGEEWLGTRAIEPLVLQSSDP
jgi:uncharacterized protein involved in high-affinity Fe2+ transport